MRFRFLPTEVAVYQKFYNYDQGAGAFHHDVQEIRRAKKQTFKNYKKMQKSTTNDQAKTPNSLLASSTCSMNKGDNNENNIDETYDADTD